MMEWIKGRPTAIGLYVIEWTNMAGLAVYLVYKRKGKLRYMACDTGHGNKTFPMKNWSISRHLQIPQPEPLDDVNSPSTYEQDHGNGFNLELGHYGQEEWSPESCLEGYKELVAAFGKPLTKEDEIEFLQQLREDELREDQEDAD